MKINWKRIDPKVVASQTALLIVGGAVVALVWWATDALKRAQNYQDPTQKAIEAQGLLN